MEEMFDIEKFNVISDEENYYFFRSLEPGDIKDLEEGNIKDENGNYIRLRTDRERWEGTHSLTPRWNSESQVTLEEMYNHIKTPYSLETNCISLSSNANVARTYGETFSDKYVMIKVPKKEMGQRVYNAGQYMLSEIAKKVQERIAQGNIPEEVLEDLKKIQGILTFAIEDDSGKFRNHGEAVYDGDIQIFMAPPHRMVSTLMDNLFSWMNEAKEKVNPLNFIFYISL